MPLEHLLSAKMSMEALKSMIRQLAIPAIGRQRWTLLSVLENLIQNPRNVLEIKGITVSIALFGTN
jgi:hypothetical protein